MKELKNRIKGLSAILLAVSLALCLVMRFSGVRASAEIKGSITIDTDTYGPSSYKLKDAIDNKIVTKQLFVSGGFLVIAAANDDVVSNISYGTSEQYNSTTYYKYAQINSNSGYSGFTITDGSCVEDGNNKYYSLTVQFVKEPETASGSNMGAIGVGTYYMTAERQYSFPSGSSTHKVQGDPTVYYAKDFYVSSSGTYTIEQ